MADRKRRVTERDLRMPEFRDFTDDFDALEFRSDGKIVRKDRWENAIHAIRNRLGDCRKEFEVSEVVDAVGALIASIPRPPEEEEN